MLTKLSPAEGTSPIENVTQDYRAAQRYGQYKISSKALYSPNGTYVDLKQISKIAHSHESIPTNGGCGITVPTPCVTFYIGDKKYRLLAASEKQAQKMQAALIHGRAE